MDQNCRASSCKTAKVNSCQRHGLKVKSMAQYHVASQLSAESESQNMRLHRDGTTKFGCSYTTFKVQKSDQ